MERGGGGGSLGKKITGRLCRVFGLVACIIFVLSGDYRAIYKGWIGIWRIVLAAFISPIQLHKFYLQTEKLLEILGIGQNNKIRA